MRLHFDPICHACGRPTLMGIHPLCLLSSLDRRLSQHNLPRRKNTCKGCPFMRSTTHWMLCGLLFMNRKILIGRVVQACHASTKCQCEGELRAIAGDPEAHNEFSLEQKVYNPPKTLKESRLRYNNNVSEI